MSVLERANSEATAVSQDPRYSSLVHPFHSSFWSFS